MTQNSPWVPQENGTHLPSPELTKRVRENPDQFPNAVEDFTAISGLPREEVEGILANRARPGGGMNPYLRNYFRGQAGVLKGLGEAVGTAADYLLPGQHGDTIRNATNFNQGFANEDQLLDTVSQIVGQAAPTVVAAAGAPSVAAAVGVGAGVTTLTFEAEDNLANFLDEITEGDMPSWMVVNEDDSTEVATAKHLAINLTIDAALGGLGSGVAKIYRTFKEVPDGFADMRLLREMSDELGIPLREAEVPTSAPDALRRGADEPTQLPAIDVAAETPQSPEAIRRVVSDAVEKQLDEMVIPAHRAPSIRHRDQQVFRDLLRSDKGHLVPAMNDVPVDSIKGFRAEVFNPISRFLGRTDEVNIGRRARNQNAMDRGELAPYQAHAENVFIHLHRGEMDDVLRLLRAAPRGTSETTRNIDGIYLNSLLTNVMHRMSDRTMDVVRALREDPSLTTREAWTDYIRDASRQQLAIAEMHREVGSAQSYGLLVRKPGMMKEGKHLDDYVKVEDTIARELRDKGLDMRATEAEYVFGKALEMEELGFDSYRLLGRLTDDFAEFDRLRAGALHNAKNSRIAKMSDSEKIAYQNSYLKAFQDLHISALLGQISTSGLEVVSNTASNLLGPITRETIGGGRGVKRAAREYAGYAASFGQAWDHFKKSMRAGRGIFDDWDIMDGSHAGLTDYGWLRDTGKVKTYWALRAWKAAADVNMSASDSAKFWRAYGIAYADGAEMAASQGLRGKQAREMANKYATTRFTEGGRARDHTLKLEAQEELWQSAFDTRYVTGRLAQSADNFRQSPNPIAATLTRFAIPVFRTLVNIAGKSGQAMVPPGAPMALRQIAKHAQSGKKGSKVAESFLGAAKFLDDFTGRNGMSAQTSAQARQRIGMAAMGAAYFAPDLFDNVELTGPSMWGRWDVRSSRYASGHPPSSLIIGDKSVDLTRLLPFSAPLLFAGAMREKNKDQEMEMANGSYTDRDYSADMANSYLSAMGLMAMSTMSDAAAFRGVGDLMDAVNTATNEGNINAITRWAKRAGIQLTPSVMKMAGKNQGLVNDVWTQRRGEGFFEELMASSGFQYGYVRRDFLGKPMDDDWFRGIDPYNVRPTKVNRDDLYREFADLNRDGSLALRQDNPYTVFNKGDWRKIGVENGVMGDLARELWAGGNVPSLTQLKVTDGTNAWDRFEELIYNSEFTQDETASTARYGDRTNLGQVSIRAGENYEETMRRIIREDWYQDFTPDARTVVWRAVFGEFRRNARDAVADTLVLPPEIFENSRFGKTWEGETTLSEAQEAMGPRRAEVMSNQGLPESRLDRIFATD